MANVEQHKGLTRVEHRALKSVAVQFFVNGAVVASYVPRLPEIRSTIGLSLPGIGLVLAAATGFGVFGSVIQAPIITSLGTRRTMTLSSLVLVLGLGLVGFAESTATLIAALAVIAVSDVVTDVAMNMQGSALSDRRTTPVVNRLHGFWSLGTVVGGLVASFAAAAGFSLRLHVIASAVVLGLTLIYVASGLLDSDAGLLGTDVSEQVSGDEDGVGRIVLLFFAVSGFANIPEVISSDWAAFRLADDLGASNGVAGLGFVAFTSGMVVGRFNADHIVERHGSFTVLRSATGLAAVGILIATTVPLIAVSIGGYVLAGLGVSVMFPQIYDAAARSSRSKGALGGLTAGSRIALLAAPVVVGGLAGADSFSVGAAVALVTIPAAIGVLTLSPLISKDAVGKVTQNIADR